MEHFEVISQCYKQGKMEFSAATAAPIMGVTLKTARNYLKGITKPDKARLRLLRAVLGEKIIPQEIPLWYNEKKMSICTDTGHSFDHAQLNNYAWFRIRDEQKIDELKRKVEALKLELHEKKNQITALQKDQPTALPTNVILFPIQRKEHHPC